MAAPSKAGAGRGWRSELHEAVWTGDIPKIESLLDGDASLDETELDMQPLNLSIIKENITVAKLLLERGAKVDGGETPALFTACALEKPAMVKLLLEHKASLTAEDRKQKIAAIHITADKGFLDILELLLAAGADPNLRSSEGRMTPLHYAASCGRLPVVQRLLSAGSSPNAMNISDNTPLLMACNKGHIDTVRELLKANADLTIHGKPDGLTALHAAVVFGGTEGFVDVAKALIEARAPINDKSVDGMLTPLHCAAAKGHVECVRLLVKNGADVHAVDKFSSTPLRIAASNANSLEDLSRFKQVADILLGAGADINSTSAAGNTPLHSVVKTNDIDLIRHLLDKGGNPYRRNHEGVSAIDMARTEEVRKLLLSVPPQPGDLVPDAGAAARGAAAGGSAGAGAGAGAGAAGGAAAATAAGAGAGGAAAAATGLAAGAAVATTGAAANVNGEEPVLFTKKNWQPDDSVSACTQCNAAFSLTNRRHHCRICGKIFCAKCSSNTLSFKTSKKPVRSCSSCYHAFSNK